MAKEKTFSIYLSDPNNKEGGTYFSLDGKKYWVRFNETTEVPEWVYDIWKTSFWNPNRVVTDSMRVATSHVESKTCDLELKD